MHGPLDIDYPRFEIHIGREPEEWRLKDIDGNSLPQIVLPVKIIIRQYPDFRSKPGMMKTGIM